MSTDDDGGEFRFIGILPNGVEVVLGDGFASREYVRDFLADRYTDLEDGRHDNVIDFTGGVFNLRHFIGFAVRQK